MGANDDYVIVGPCPTCDLGDLWARPGEEPPPACEACLAEQHDQQQKPAR